MELQVTQTAHLPRLLFQRERVAAAEAEPAGDEVEQAIARATRRWPGLHPVLLHTEVLVREDDVYQPSPSRSAVALIKPASDLVFRLVCPSPTGLACSCEAWPPSTLTGPGDGLYCADVLAYLLAIYLERPLSPLPYAPEELWELTLQELQLQMTKASFNQWLHGSSVNREASTPYSVTVVVRNRYAQEWLAHRLHPLIARMLAAIAGYEVQVCFVVL